jgi:hypothetical protein|tara:strand:- start:226 stop:528 length:303 start_codon:yes stop_codon:yes gene_type:complete
LVVVEVLLMDQQLHLHQVDPLQEVLQVVVVEEVELSLVAEEEQQLNQLNLVSLELLDKETEVQVELMLVVFLTTEEVEAEESLQVVKEVVIHLVDQEEKV